MIVAWASKAASFSSTLPIECMKDNFVTFRIPAGDLCTYASRENLKSTYGRRGTNLATSMRESIDSSRWSVSIRADVKGNVAQVTIIYVLRKLETSWAHVNGCLRFSCKRNDKLICENARIFLVFSQKERAVDSS